MDIDDDDDLGNLDPTNPEILEELDEDMFVYLYKKASKLFFDGDLVITPDFDPYEKGDNEYYHYASIKFGKVKLHRPKF
ncbi:hypothetical protein CR513_39712, partial [Mucuna pruriens]